MLQNSIYDKLEDASVWPVLVGLIQAIKRLLIGKLTAPLDKSVSLKGMGCRNTVLVV
jgi:hypothetical protein